MSALWMAQIGNGNRPMEVPLNSAETVPLTFAINTLTALYRAL